MSNNPQAVIFFQRFAKTFTQLESKLQQLSQESLSAEDFKIGHRKLLKLLNRSHSYFLSLRQLDLPETVQSQLAEFERAYLRFYRAFLMRSVLPENALERFYLLPIEQLANIFLAE